MLSIDALDICLESPDDGMALAFLDVRFALLTYIVFRFVVETVQGSVGSVDYYDAANWLSIKNNADKVRFFLSIMFFLYGSAVKYGVT